MQKGRTAGQSFKPKRFADIFDSPHPIQVKIARVIARSEKGLTVPEIQELAGCSADSVRTLLKVLRAIKGVYISDWRQGRNATAVYSLGSLPDVEKPVLERSTVLVSKQAAPVSVEREAIKEEALSSQYQALIKALVPKRNEQEQREINRLYLNWISEGIYG